MKIRFMCLRHYCDINVEGDEVEIRKLRDNEVYLIGTSVLAAHRDGTYEFDFTNCYCPEFDSLYRAAEAADMTEAAMDKWCEQNQCQDTWTAVMYDNFTPIGGKDVPAPASATFVATGDNSPFL